MAGELISRRRFMKGCAVGALGLAGSARGAGAGGGSVDNSVHLGEIIINVPGTNATPADIGRAASNGLLDALRARGLE